jgi:hypothetical protein
MEGMRKKVTVNIIHSIEQSNARKIKEKFHNTKEQFSLVELTYNNKTQSLISFKTLWRVIQVIPGSAINASASWAIAAFLSCISETILTSPTASPDICQNKPITAY